MAGSLICNWALDNNAHEGIVLNKELFNRQHLALLCEKHFKQHLILMTLVRLGQNPEQVLMQSPEDMLEKLKHMCPNYEEEIQITETTKSY